MKHTVLLLSTYPFEQPRHGGQVRLSNIANSYKENGWEVHSLAVYEPEANDTRLLGKNDVPFDVESPYRKFRGRLVPLINDFLSGEFSSADDGAFGLILKKISRIHSIDAIHVEQPWLWPLAVKLKSLVQYRKALLVFGSQNIEAPLKKDILESYNVDDCEDVISEIEALEQTAVCEADISLAVTQSDLDILIKLGAKNAVLAPNGITLSYANHEAIERWRCRLPKTPWILYVASAHPPNFTGFTKCVGEALGCIPPTSRLVVAGSVCEHLYQQLAATKWHSLNLSRLELVGVLSDEDLAAVKLLAHAFLLPIPHGGGSNIKTAEALLSGAYVIGTPEAFRGYETFKQLPEVFVTDTPIKMQSTIRDILQRPRVPPKEGNVDDERAALQWNRCLKEVPDFVSAAVKGA
ncbi:hypothetical protein A9Q88_08640 [Gammaproteobacteria bacterium 50_400_T64]|nr:hypothetical protein A9Q88_08640 [Gammaproteobacteria bacterium 50_400_T64]